MSVATRSPLAPEQASPDDPASPPGVEPPVRSVPRSTLGRAGRWGAGGAAGGLLVGIACCGALPLAAVLGLGAGLGVLGGASALVIGLVSAVGLTAVGRRAARSSGAGCCASRSPDESWDVPATDSSSGDATTDAAEPRA